uniref:Cytochrome P450 n=1 Tax=Lotus japonicus TaxID=34305 RepID=I3S3T6_LOTJA|nr:unknown [Lotus japonicus]
MEVLILLSLLSIFIIFIVHKHKTYSTRANLPPGPPGLPLIGNLHQLDSSSPHRCLWTLSKRYGPLMSLCLGSIPTLVISSEKMAKEVFKTHDLKFASRPPFLGLRKFSYNGLDIGFTPYGPYWREIRKLCVLHLFSSKRVQSFRPMRENEVAQMIDEVSKYDHASGQVVNLTETMMSFCSG